MRSFAKVGENWVHDTAVGYFQNAMVSAVCKETAIGQLETWLVVSNSKEIAHHTKHNF